MAAQFPLTPEEQAYKAEMIRIYGLPAYIEMVKQMDAMKAAQQKKAAAPKPSAPAYVAPKAPAAAPKATQPTASFDGAKSYVLTQEEIDGKYADEKNQQKKQVNNPARPQGPADDANFAAALRIQEEENAKANQRKKPDQKEIEENERVAREMQEEENNRRDVPKHDPMQANAAEIEADLDAKYKEKERIQKLVIAYNEAAAKRVQAEEEAQEKMRRAAIDKDAEIARKLRDTLAKGPAPVVNADDAAMAQRVTAEEKEAEEKRNADFIAALQAVEQAEMNQGPAPRPPAHNPAANRPAMPQRPPQAAPQQPAPQQRPVVNPGAGADPAAFLAQFNNLRLQAKDLATIAAYLGQHEEKENAEMFNLGGKISKLLGTDEKTLEKMLGELAVILKSPSVTHENAGAHDYTKTHISKEYKTTLEIDKQLKLSDTPTLADTEKSMRDFHTKMTATKKVIPRFNLNYFNTIVANVKAKPGVDTETDINMSEMFVRCWSLATMADYYYKIGSDLQMFERGQGFDKNNNKDALEGCYRASIMQCISDNINDAGGCIPGIIARLHPIYVNLVNLFVSDILKHKQTHQQPAPKRVVLH